MESRFLLLRQALHYFRLVILFYRIFSQGLGYLNLDFLTNFASRIPENAGIKAALVGSLWLMVVVAPVSIILGVSTAIYLEEYAKKNKLNDFIRMNISNLAGVPSIVFGLLGLTIFVRMIGIGEKCFSCRIYDEFTNLTGYYCGCTRSHSCCAK